MCSRLVERIGLDAHQREDTAYRCLQTLPIQIGVVTHGLRRRGEGSKHRNWLYIAPRGVDREVRCFPEPRDPVAGLPPIGKSLLPSRRLLLGELLLRQSLRLGVLKTDPRFKVRRLQIRKGEQQVAEIALWVDGNDRDAIHRRFLDHADAQSGLAAAGHADDDRVCRQVLGVIQDQFVGALAGREVLDPAEIEGAKLFEVFHATRVRRGSTAGIRTLNTA